MAAVLPISRATSSCDRGSCLFLCRKHVHDVGERAAVHVARAVCGELDVCTGAAHRLRKLVPVRFVFVFVSVCIVQTLTALHCTAHYIDACQGGIANSVIVIVDLTGNANTNTDGTARDCRTPCACHSPL